jgi:propionyl-CoA synthetase
LSIASAIEPPAGASRYHEAYQHALRDPVGFWGAAADAIDWYEKPTKIFDPSAGIYGRWYVGATCNTCFNAVDRNVLRGRGAQRAII